MTALRTVLLLALAGAVNLAVADVEKRIANNGNLVMEGMPAIPARFADTLNRYQNVRYALFSGWMPGGDGLYVRTRFGDVDQLHRVAAPGGARHQLTYENEPMGQVAVQPRGRQIAFTRDAGGSEFAQVFLLDPDSGQQRLLTDGESRNDNVVWDRDGRRIAYRSTRRNGASNDIWILSPDRPEDAAIALESPDRTLWMPVEFSANGSKLLAVNYLGVADARPHLVDLDSGAVAMLAGGEEDPSFNQPLGFDDTADGYWLLTDQGSEFVQLAWQPLEPGAPVEVVTRDIPWRVDAGVLSHDRERMAFTVNENGRSALYLLDTKTREYRRVGNIPTGLVSSLAFSPDDARLAMTLNTYNTPSDAFVLTLGARPLDSGSLTRWTTSEVGGLDTTRFVEPTLIAYPTFDAVGGKPREIPAWLYKPPGKGPHPVVISIHGGPEGQSRPGFASTYQMWLDVLGTAVILPNVRGSRGYGKTYLSLDNGFGREDSVRDIGALLDWIATQPDLDENRVAVFGGSYGGYMVLASAVHFSDRLRAAVDVVGISNFVTFLENTQDYRRDRRRVEYGDEREPAMRAHLEKISPVNNVDRIRVPLFVVQGENDPRVPVTESTQMVRALREAGRPVWYMNALNEGHGYRKKENRDLYQQATVLFLERYLLGDAADD